ncbi:MAG TPA: glucuronate isomerase, partial [Polyangiaceae bacterium]|nr:glucuronate isomerase [Polyangiaceae bacterium]
RLYHEYAARQPIFDYHCHLDPEKIANNHRFRSLTELWLEGDHYKWRALRANGVPEALCTGQASDEAKFEAWASTVPKTLRNPLYHWTHLELKRPFGIRELLNPASARGIYERANALLATDAFRAQGLLRQFGVVVVCTTDDPIDSLEPHLAHARSEGARSLRLYPTFRPDRAFAVDDPEAYGVWLDALGAASDVEVRSYETLLEALDRRHAFFHSVGCRLSDHGLETLYAEDAGLEEVRRIFERLRAGERVSREEADKYRSAVLHELAVLDHGRGWVQQFHLGALRNNNTRLARQVGLDAGADSIGDFEMARPLARFLDRLDASGRLAKTILYNLNPRDNELFATMIGNFQDGSVPGKLQYGSAWWFLDQLDGMRRQIDALSNMGLLSRFVGMLTDSRSFLSYSRHEYFRRLLCGLLGSEVERGLLPSDFGLVGGLVEDLCFFNARDYFGLALPEAASAQNG